jgi:hypothetical protein
MDYDEVARGGIYSFSLFAHWRRKSEQGEQRCRTLSMQLPTMGRVLLDVILSLRIVIFTMRYDTYGLLTGWVGD